MKKKFHALIIEDAGLVAEDYKVLLRKEGVESIICSNGNEAKKIIENGDKFDFAIVDIVLPPEDSDNIDLEYGMRTGLRMIKLMKKHKTTNCFLVISIFDELRKDVGRACKGSKWKFVSKRDCEPEIILKFVETL